MPASDFEGARMDADLRLALDIKQMFDRLSPARPEKIDDHDSYQLMAKDNEGQPRARFYFDQQSGLLLRLIRYSLTPFG
jgi:hypothetical protein